MKRLPNRVEVALPVFGISGISGEAVLALPDSAVVVCGGGVGSVPSGVGFVGGSVGGSVGGTAGFSFKAAIASKMALVCASTVACCEAVSPLTSTESAASSAVRS